MVGRRQRDCAGCGAGGLPRPGVLLFVYAPGSREDAAEGVLPGLRQGPCAELRTPGGAGCVPGAARSGVEGEIGRFRGRHMTPVPRAASLAELNQMLADADEVDEHRRIAARVETDGQAAAREVPLLNPLPGNAFQAAAALSCRVDAKGDDLCPAVVLFGAGPRLAGRRGARSRWALTGSTSGMTGFWSPGTPDHCTRAARTWCWTTTWRSSCTGRVRWPVPPPWSVPRADRRVHRWAPPTVLGHRTPQGRGPRRHQGADRGAAAAPHPAHRGGARRDRRSGGVVLPQVRDRGHPSGCGGTLAQVSLHPRQFRVTGHAPRAACPSRSVDEHPRGEASFADRAWSARGRPGVVPRRDLGCGVRGCHGFAAPAPLLGCRGWIHLPGPRSPLLAPRGIPPIPGARSNRHRGAISS
jgi:hypothetical protein